ncbi:MAG: shikimate kinase [Endomicrobium sp.]|jgi:shikimate kinase|nr:shikimate kinase [Endomicrobium sp.]
MNLVFTGFMSTGKSKTGEIISRRLNRSFFDTDVLVEGKSGLTIVDIFKNLGEASFRQLEAEVVKEVSERDSIVISCGGGVVLDPRNIVFLRKKGIIINLYASAEVIYERSKSENSNNRPLLRCRNPLKEIKRLLNLRENFYSDCDFSFNTDNLTSIEVADEILSSNVAIKNLLR